MEKMSDKTSGRVMRHLIIVIAAASAVAVGCNKFTNTYRADHGLPPCEYTASLDSLFTPLFPDAQPGAIVTVMRNDTIIYNHAFGLARLDSSDYITDSTLFNLASASKSFCAAAILKLCEQGTLSLDDSLSKYFPEFNNELFDRIQIRNILTHSSGLPDLRPSDLQEWNKYVKNHETVFSEGPDYRLYGSEKEHMQIFRDLGADDYTPSTEYQRTDPAFILVVPLIERVTGRDFDSWMSDNIFKPAGMTDTYYYNPGCTLPRMAHGYRRTNGNTRAGVFRSADGRWEEYDYGEADYFLTKADRGAYSSARDFMRWNRALYSGKIISKQSLDSINTSYLTTADEPNVTYGFANAIENIPGKPIKIYHLNTNGGFSITEATIPERKISYLIFATRADWDQRGVFDKVDSILLK